MTRRVFRNILRYIREYEHDDGVRIVDAAPEFTPLYDSAGNLTGCNILFSCEVERRDGREQ